MAKNNKDSQKDTKKKTNTNKKSTNKKANNNKKVNNKSTSKKKTNTKVEKKIEKKEQPKKEIINKFEDKSDELLFDFVNKPEEEKKQKSSITFGILDVLIIAVVVAIITCLVVGTTLNNRYKKMGCGYNQTYSSDKNLNEFIKIYAEVVDNYYEDVDKDAMIDAAISGMLDFLEDKYSIYLDVNDSGDLSDSLSGTYNGIGIAIYGANITEVYKGSPAEEAGVKSGDVISSINGIAIDNENAGEITKIIGDSEDIALVVKRNNEEISYDLKVSKITLQVVTSQYFKLNNKAIGYIDSFSSTSVEQFAESLIELEEKGIDSLIIDLRGNGGGYISSAVGISSILMKESNIIYMVEKKGNREEVIDKSEDSRDYKIVILIDKNTASASEILTLALRDNNGAIVVGTKSYGKGSVQTTKTLSDGSMMKYTSAKWYGPKGESIDGVGIIPDYEVKYQSGKDAPFEKALDLLK